MEETNRRRVSDEDADNGYHSGEKIHQKPGRSALLAQYTMSEEAHVVRKFDRKLVPLLALLYLLSFLDRSSMFGCCRNEAR